MTNSGSKETRAAKRLRPGRFAAAPTLVMMGAVTMLALPSAVLAFSTRIDMPTAGLSENPAISGYRSGTTDPRLARVLAASPTGATGPLFRFTPAGLVTRPDRSVTVAVRVDPVTARAIIVRGVLADRAGRGPVASLPVAVATLGIAPTVYSLGVARGYEGFGQSAPAFSLTQDSHRPDLPDLSNFKLSPQDQPSRLAPHIALDDRQRPGSSPRTLESDGVQTVDLGGSYRLARNLDVTAGLRYQRDRDRIDSTADKIDTQAVFVGTQFKF